MDIGGGTIDGCIFRLIRERSGRPEVNVLSAKVLPLGTIIVAQKALGYLLRGLEQRVEKEIVTRNEIKIEVPLPLDAIAEELGNFAATLLIDARNKSLGQALIQNQSATSGTAELERELTKGFVFMVGGGGATSGWYRETFAAVHSERDLAKYNIMPFDCRIVEPSRDFASSSGVVFARFIIAHGLTNDAPNLEDLTTRLPSQLRDGETLPAQSPVGPGGIGYSDTKDAFT